MPSDPARPPAVLGDLGDPGVGVCEPSELLLGYLDWYRERLVRKVAGLSDRQLRAPVPGLGWAPLGMVQHLGWVERRWLHWGFAADDTVAYPPGSDGAEWHVAQDRATEAVFAGYAAEVGRSREITDGMQLDEPAKLGGRFRTPDEVPCLGRILFHLLQEYARHVGQLDVARELIDGQTGE
jgi:uncharacterized damage-inducible protein DinB